MKSAVDVAFMRWTRRCFAEIFSTESSAAAAGKLDSSSQGNFNWLNSEMIFVKSPDIVPLARAFKSLVALTMQDIRDTEAAIDSIQSMSNYVEHHHQVPVGVGSGRASVAHETHAYYWPFALDSPSSRILGNVLACFVGNCTDKGTEHNIPRGPTRRSSEWFPYMHYGPRALPNFEPEHGAMDEEVADAFQDENGANDEEHEEGIIADADPALDLPRSLDISGGMHVQSIVAKSALDAMDYYNEFII